MLSGLGVGGDIEADITFIEDLTDLIQEVVDDLYVRRFCDAGARRSTAPKRSASGGSRSPTRTRVLVPQTPIRH